MVGFILDHFSSEMTTTGLFSFKLISTMLFRNVSPYTKYAFES